MLQGLNVIKDTPFRELKLSLEEDVGLGIVDSLKLDSEAFLACHDKKLDFE